ncbi:MAG TPA: MFS transporter [Bradyrhizobium sp.]|nr:MFS transporter [Bradyrhizobium sp.]
MTMDRSAAEATALEPAPEDLPPSVRRSIFLYLGILIVLLAFGGPSGGLIDIPISFFLKNRLHLEAHEVARFRLIASIPLYLSFVFGFIRDSWNPLQMRDRGFMLLFGGICALLYLGFAFVPMSYATLLVAIIVLTASFLFVASAQNGLTSTIGQQHAMTGRISAAWNVFMSVPMVATLLIGGWFSNLLEAHNDDSAARILFLAGAAIMTAISLYALWKPGDVFSHVHAERGPELNPVGDIRRLFGHWRIYPALLIWFLWNFAPGSATPLQYHLQNTLHASDAQWGQWNAIFAASFVPTFIAYGILCRRYALRTLLWFGTLIAVPQMIPLLFIHSMTGALFAAIPIGLMGGVATGAYMDLIIRSCPRGLQGTMLMLSGSLYSVVTRFGDVLGTALYDHYGGFTVCVAAITLVYALILPTLLLVPKPLIATADGQAPARLGEA